jgi:hypothetical protein
MVGRYFDEDRRPITVCVRYDGSWILNHNHTAMRSFISSKERAEDCANNPRFSSILTNLTIIDKCEWKCGDQLDTEWAIEFG